jgi:monoamine oxidase
MSMSETEVVVVGGGAAGVAATRRLHDAGVPCLLVEARSRLGGRAFTFHTRDHGPIDLGCGWLHSADRNPWVAIAQARGRTIDKSAPPWSKRSDPRGFSFQDQAAFSEVFGAFYERLEAADLHEDRDAIAASFLEQDNRWNGLINAASTYISGAYLDQLSALDLRRYDGNEINWRVPDGYGTLVSAHAGSAPVVFDSPVRRIDHSGKRVRVETAKGIITADAVIVTLPTTVLAEEAVTFFPALPEKVNAAAGLPLGHDDKLFVSLTNAEEFATDSRIFVRTDRAETPAYQFRPLGRPQIEVYFGGPLAASLEGEGDAAFFELTRDELASLLGNDFRQRIAPLGIHRWGTDEYARGAYSYATPGNAGARRILAAPVDGRLFFAGEACSANDFSTAHGAYLTGLAAADAAMAARLL